MYLQARIKTKECSPYHENPWDLPLYLSGPRRTRGRQLGTSEGHQPWERGSVRLASGLGSRGWAALCPGSPGPPAPDHPGGRSPAGATRPHLPRSPWPRAPEVAVGPPPQPGHSPRQLPQAPPSWTGLPCPAALSVGLTAMPAGRGGGAGAGSWPPLRHLPATRPLRGGGCGAGVKEAGETLEVRGQREAGEGAVGAEEAGPGGHTTWGGHSPEHAPHRPWAPPGCHLPGPPPCSVAWSPRWSWGGPTVGAPRGLHLKACDSPAVVSAPPPPSSVA